MLATGELVNGRYRILHKVGQGGMSVVYLARDEVENRQWAVKEVRREGVQDFRVVEQGLITETNMLIRLNHPNLPRIVDVIENEERFLIVMDFIDGISLKDRLGETGVFFQEDVIRWGKQLCDVLSYLHSQEPPIIYRDLKPANIMLKPDGNIELIDFGTAREYKTGNQEDTINIGTVGYAAPEQYGGMGQSDARTDIYCLGVTLYQLVTGKNPCEPPYLIVPIRHWNPELSAGLEAVILKCTQTDPVDRFQSCDEVYQALEQWCGDGWDMDGGNVRPRKPGFLERLFGGRSGKGRATQPSGTEMPAEQYRGDAQGWQDEVSGWQERPAGWQEEPAGGQDRASGWQPDAARYQGEAPGGQASYGEDDTALLLPKESVPVGRFVLIKDIVEIHTDEVI